MSSKPTHKEPPVDRVVRKVISPIINKDSGNKVIQNAFTSTKGIVTPSNILDVYAMKKCKDGIDNLDTWRGIVTACGSLMADLVDGPIARVTNTSSPVGEAIDAVGDKIKLAYALMKIHKLELAPDWATYGVAAQNSINTALTLTDQALNRENPVIHASWAGKRAIFLQQWGLGLHVVGSRLEKDSHASSKYVKSLGSVATTVGLALGIVASTDYASRLVDSRRNN